MNGRVYGLARLTKKGVCVCQNVWHWWEQASSFVKNKMHLCKWRKACKELHGDVTDGNAEESSDGGPELLQLVLKRLQGKRGQGKEGGKEGGKEERSSKTSNITKAAMRGWQRKKEREVESKWRGAHV